MTPELTKLMEEQEEKFLNEVLPVVYKAMDEAKIVYSEDQLEHMASDAFSAGFTAAVQAMEEIEKENITLKLHIECLKDPYNFPNFIRDFLSLTKEQQVKITNLAISLKEVREVK